MRWRITALIVMLVGCFDAHGGGPLGDPLDGGRPVDWAGPGPEPDGGRPLPRDLGHDPGRDWGAPADGGRDLGADASACLPAEESCHSRLDLDCDGRRGCIDDCDCWPTSIGPCGAADPGDELSCSNGLNDDFDLLVDCDDPDCADATACGGPGRCGYVDLGGGLPVRRMFLFPVVDQVFEPSCAPDPASADSSYRWVAPTAGRFRFTTNGGPIAVYHGDCDGSELGCGLGAVTLDLHAGQHVIVALEGRACLELGIDSL